MLPIAWEQANVLKEEVDGLCMAQKAVWEEEEEEDAPIFWRMEKGGSCAKVAGSDNMAQNGRGRCNRLGSRRGRLG